MSKSGSIRASRRDTRRTAQDTLFVHAELPAGDLRPALGSADQGPTFRSLAEAKTWRTLKAADVVRGKVDLPSSRTLRSVAEEFLAGAASGAIMNSHGLPYKPKVLRDYRADLERRVFRTWGQTDHRHPSPRYSAPDRPDGEQGLSGSRIRNVLNSLRSVYRFALSRIPGVEETPLSNLELPANREKRRERIADPVEARALTGRATGGRPADLGDRDVRGSPGPASYAHSAGRTLTSPPGRSGSSAAGTTARARSSRSRVRSANGANLRGTPPVSGGAATRVWVVGHGPGLVFGRLPGVPFNDRAVTDRAKRAWGKAGLRHLGLHEARHSFASLAITSGVGFKEVSVWMGHSSIAGITLDHYSHLAPDAGEQAVAKLDAYLAQTG